MTEKHFVKPEQAKILEELEKIVDRTIPQVKEFKWSTFGVKIEDGNVVGLGLYDRMLSTLPESITKLESLQILYLYENQLSTLPKSISKLTSLQTLQLGSNKFATLPESISNLKSLTYLNLGVNKLTTLPESISNLKSLQQLDLDNNKFKTFPESITKLTLLETLNLSCNQLTTLPESITKLTSLQTLRLDVNQLSALPESIGSLSSLRKLLLYKNKLTTLPESFCQLKSLEEIDLKDNNWTGEWADMVRNDIPAILNLCRKLYGMIIFISHAWDDQEQYQVVELNDYLEENVIKLENEMDMDIIHDVYICEKDVVDDIWKFMTENVPKSHLLLFITTNNSIVSEACRYELFLANKYGVEILPIKGTDITWEELSQINLIDLNKQYQGNLDLSSPKEKFEFAGKNFDKIFRRLREYIETHESELKKNKKRMEELENTKKKFKDVINSREFKAIIKEHLDDFNELLEELNKNQITIFKYFLKLGQTLKEKEN